MTFGMLRIEYKYKITKFQYNSGKLEEFMPDERYIADIWGKFMSLLGQYAYMVEDDTPAVVNKIKYAMKTSISFNRYVQVCKLGLPQGGYIKVAYKQVSN